MLKCDSGGLSLMSEKNFISVALCLEVDIWTIFFEGTSIWS